jgi:two-component system, response regulator, stage 0 sporulation protein F
VPRGNSPRSWRFGAARTCRVTADAWHEVCSEPRVMLAHLRCGTRPLRVLLAEDDDALREMLASSLRLDGHEVVEARDGRELVGRTGPGPEGAGSYDLIVSDVMMPGANGIMALSRLAEDASAPPVVMITAFGDDELHAWARSIGAVATFDKPFDVDDLCTLALNLPLRAAGR